MYMMNTRETAEISISSKSRLAKLLAAENIHVEHRSVSTAAFDVKNRVLILPMWKDITEDLYDLLVLHEVGHALYTPLDGWHGAASTRPKHFKGFLNITEDARIEKKIKRKFPGGRKSFIKGYVDLMDRDFFGLKDRSVHTLNFIDRINIHTKAGLASGVQFSYEEAPFVRMVEAAETFAEAEAAAVAIYDYMGGDSGAMTDTNPTEVEWDDDEDGDTEEGETTEVEVPDTSEDGDDGEDSDGSTGEEDDTSDDEPEDGDGSEADDGESTDEEEAEENSTSGKSDGDSKDDEEENGSSTDDGAAGDTGGESSSSSVTGNPRATTDEAFRDHENDLVDEDAEDISYTQVPSDNAFNLDTIIIDPNYIHDKLLAYADEYSPEDNPATAKAKKELANFKAANTKTVNYLAKEFEMRKAADASSRASVARTGVLDVNNLHSYKWNDDVFKRITNIPDGKSHGLVMFIDWSGSMGGNIKGSIDQVLNLVLFCKKVNIPFDVYAFTNAARSEVTNSKNDRMNKSKLEMGDFTFRRESFNLLHLVTSNAKASEFQKHLTGMMMLRGGMGWGYSREYSIPGWLGLGGTPLNEAIMTAIPVVNKFRADNGLQIVNTAFLTDGEGSGLHYVHDPSESDGTRSVYNSVIRDKVSRKEWSSSAWGMSGVLLDVFRARTGSKVVNFFIVEDAKRHFSRRWIDAHEYRPEDAAVNAAWKEAKSEGGVSVEDNTANWDSYYLIPGGAALVIDEDGGLSDDLIGAKKGQLKRAFAKAATGKLRNRVILREFVDLIAA
jgi:hypothetical protein